MDAIKEFLHLEDGLFKQKGKFILWSFISAYAIFALNIVPVNAILALILLLFLIAPVKECFFMFIFYTLWENVSVFSNGITLNLFFHSILFIKIIISKKDLKGALHHKLRAIVLFWILFTFFYAIICFLSSNSFTGVNIFMKALFALYALSYMKNDTRNHLFWKTLFQLIVFSTLLSVIYGERYDTSLERWITGLDGNYGMQLYGTLGTTRLGMFTVISIIYPLYYVKNKTLKIVLITSFTILTFMTISLTAFALLLGLWGIYVLSLGYKWYKLGFITSLIIGGLFILLPTLTNIDFIKPVALRIIKANEVFETGDINKVTSGREELGTFYINRFEQSSFIVQLLGEGYASGLSASQGTNNMNSHNSYLDMVFYYGILGIILFIFVILRKVFFFKRSTDFYPIFSLKILFLLVGATVSIFTGTFWTFFLFI